MPRRALAVVALAALAGGCVPRPDARTGAGGVEHISAPGTPPVVVFENGLGATLGWWSRVIAALPPGTAHFAYNRPGYGLTPASGTPRDGATMTSELRALLAAEGLRPPYILVGHSYGGLLMQLFARTHPDETAGLVLVDSTHPQQLDGDGAMARQSWWVRAAVGLYARDTVGEELALIPETGRQVLALPPPQGVPVVVISALRPMRGQGSAAARWANRLRVELVQLYPGARQVWVDSSHAVPRERPGAIAEAILAVQPRR